MKKCPCKGCPDRRLTCHIRGNCKPYDAWKDELAKTAENKRAATEYPLLSPEIKKMWYRNMKGGR